MIYIDKFAYTNNLSQINSLEKFIFGLSNLCLSSFFNSIYLYTFIIFTNSVLLLISAKIPFRFYFKLMLVPLYFLSAAILSIIIEPLRTSAIPEYILTFLGLGITPNNLTKGLIIFLKSFAGISCLYFIALTVPLGEIIHIFRKIKIPELLIELTLLIYRFIFLIIEVSDNIHIAQKARLGNLSFNSRLTSFIKLAGSVFILSYKKYNDFFNGLQSRCYKGKFEYIPLQRTPSIFYISLFFIIDLFFLTLGILTSV